MSQESDEKRVDLYRVKGATDINIVACITSAGALEIIGSDVGEAPRRSFGCDEYEYEVTVAAEQKDDLLLALVESQFGRRNDVVSSFRAFCADRGISSDFATWYRD